MKTFTYSQCNNEFVLSIKKEYKQHDNDSSIKAKYITVGRFFCYTLFWLQIYE